MSIICVSFITQTTKIVTSSTNPALHICWNGSRGDETAASFYHWLPWKELFSGKTKEVKLVKIALEQNPILHCKRAAGTASPEESADCWIYSLHCGISTWRPNLKWNHNYCQRVTLNPYRLIGATELCCSPKVLHVQRVWERMGDTLLISWVHLGIK